MNDIQELRKYIYAMIPKITKNHEVITNFFDINQISRTDNNNGTFVNLAVIDDDIICKLYELIIQINRCNENNLVDNLNALQEEYIKKNMIIHENIPNIIQKKVYKNLQIRRKIDKEIVRWSKEYYIN